MYTSIWYLHVYIIFTCILVYGIYMFIWYCHVYILVYCIVLYCIVLYCIVLYCIVLQYSIWCLHVYSYR